jgi:hypothetical protein
LTFAISLRGVIVPEAFRRIDSRKEIGVKLNYSSIYLFLSRGLLGAIAICAIGCEPMATGRAGAGEGYAKYVAALYSEPAVNHGPRSIEFPINVAVAQVGQTSPSRAVTERLSKARDVFRRVSSMSAEMHADFTTGPHFDPLPRLQAIAKDQGADYLLIFGASVETQTRIDPQAGLDFTIVGAFAVPSREVEADASASAALIDVRSGTVVLTAGGEASKTRWATAATTYAEEDRARGLAVSGALLNLAEQLIGDAQRRSADDNAAGIK